MDKSLGDLMDYLEVKGIAQNTVIIFMSDNGGYTIGRTNKNYPLSEGKGSLKEGGIRDCLLAGSHTTCYSECNSCDNRRFLSQYTGVSRNERENTYSTDY